MIYGPITPRNTAGLAAAVVENPEAIESGLRLVASAVEVGAGIAIDHLAVDAARVPVLVFVAEPGADRSVPVRVAEALSWFDDCGAALGPLLQGGGALLDGRIRALVIGYELSGLATDRLRALGDPRLAVIQLEPYAVGGHQRMGRVIVLPEDPVTGPVLDGESLVPGALVPGTLVPEEERDLVDRMLDLLGRLEPDLSVSGDRYCRVLGNADGPLLEIRRAGDIIEARVQDPSAEFVQVSDEEDVVEVVDAVARQMLRLEEQRAAAAKTAGREDARAPSDSAAGRRREEFTSASDLGRSRIARRTIDEPAPPPPQGL